MGRTSTRVSSTLRFNHASRVVASFAHALLTNRLDPIFYICFQGLRPMVMSSSSPPPTLTAMERP